MTQEALKQMYQLLLTEPHAPTVCAQLERIAREALADHAMRETQRLGQEIEQAPYSVQQAYAMAQVCLDLHEALGCKWGDNPYLTINQLKASPPQRTWVGLTKNERLELYRQFEDFLESDDWEYEKAIEAKIKEKNT